MVKSNEARRFVARQRARCRIVPRISPSHAMRQPPSLPTSPPKPQSQPKSHARSARKLPEPLALQDELGHLIRRAHQLAVATFHGTHGRDVTPVQYAVLRALLKEPGIDQVTLAQRVALDTSTTADIATRLESKGWIARVLLARRHRSLHIEVVPA